uniref:ribonuclease H2 subunit C n=1 Tax=Myxine glutinosa TaxID=7769 RepID=UPI00358FF70B
MANLGGEGDDDGLHMTVDSATLQKAPDSDAIHFLPCQVKCTGPAPVSCYFTPAISKTDEDEVKTVSFRGYELKGKELSLPPDYVGLVLREDPPPDKGEERHARTLNKFSKLTYWNLETPPNPDDCFAMAMTWPKLADEIHAPVED